MSKPVIIYVSGAPGSGKTTLAEKISAEFYIPHVSSDLVHGGVQFTKHTPINRENSLHNVFVPLLVSMARAGISFVVDQVLQRGLSEADIIEKLRPNADLIYIHTATYDPIRRHLQRELNRQDQGRVLTTKQLKERAKYHQGNLTNTSAPLDLGIPTIEVDTSDGYTPNFGEISEFIKTTFELEGKA